MDYIKNVTGSNISITDSNGDNTLKTELLGDMSQESYTGKSLFGGFTYTNTVNGITFTYNKDGSITANGTSTASCYSMGSAVARENGYLVTLEPGTYSVGTGLSNVLITVVKSDGNVILNTSDANRTKQFTIEESTDVFLRLQINNSGVRVTNKTVYVMLEKSNTYTGWEPYVGKKAAPNPDYPQEIKVGSVTNVKILGKNLFDYKNNLKSSVSGLTNTLNDDGSITTTGIPTADYVQITNRYTLDDILDNNASYTISQENYTAGANLRLVVCIYDKIKDTSQYITASTTSQTFTVNKSKYGYDIWIQTDTSSSWGSSSRTFTNKYQLEKASTASTFEPYKEKNYTLNLGKNLFKTPTTIPTDLNGVTVTRNNDGSITLDGTCTESGGIYATLDEPLNLKGKYSFSLKTVGTISTNGQCMISLRKSDNSSALLNPTIGTNQTRGVTNTVDVTATKIQIYINAGIELHCTVYPQLEKGPTITDYVQYITPIELCKLSTYQDKIMKTIGKNLFDKDNADLINSYFSYSNTGELIENNDNRTLIIECEPNTTYTVSKVASQRFRIGSHNERITSGVVNTSVYGGADTTNLTITTGANDVYLYVYYYTNSVSETLTEQQILDTIQIEKGTSATYYEPYGKDEWFIYKAIGKVTIKGTETVNVNNSGTANWYYGITVNEPTADETIGLCTHYQNVKVYNANTNQGIMLVNAGNRIRIRYGTEDTASNFKTWLSNNNVTLYYPKSKNGGIKITSTELIEQLNEINNMSLYYGYNNIISLGDLPVILDTTYNDWNKDINPSDRQALLDGTASIQTKIEVHNENLINDYNTNIIRGLLNDGGVLYYDNTWRTVYINCEPNTTYTITKKQGRIFRVAEFKNEPKLGDSWTNRQTNNTGTKIYYSTGSEGNYLAITYYAKQFDTLTEEELFDSIVVEKTLDGNNLFSINNTETDYHATFTIINNQLIVVSNGDYARVKYSFQGEIGKQYTIKTHFINQDSKSIGLRAYATNTSSTLLQSAYTSDEQGNLCITFTPITETTIIKFYSNTTETSYTNSVTFDNITLWKNKQIILTEEDSVISWNHEDFRYVKEQGFIGQFVARQLTGELKNISNDFNITDKELNVEMGVKVNNNTNWYSLGNFMVTKVTDDEVNDKTSFEALDYTKKFNKKYEDMIAYPCTALDLAINVCEQCGVELVTKNFKNKNYTITGNVFKNNESCRDVLKEIGKLAFSWVRVDWDNKVYIDFNKDDYINENNIISNNKYYNLKTQKEKYKVNKIIIGYSQIEGERTFIEDTESIDENGVCELTVYDNPLVYTQEQRDSIIESARDLMGLEYLPLNMLTVGHPWLKGKELIQVNDMENVSHTTIPFDRTIQYFGHIKTLIDVAAETRTNDSLAYEPEINKDLMQTEIKVDKNTGDITALTSRTSTLEDEMGNVYTKTQTNELIQNAATGVTNTFSEAGGNNIFRNTGLWFESSGKINLFNINQSGGASARATATVSNNTLIVETTSDSSATSFTTIPIQNNNLLGKTISLSADMETDGGSTRISIWQLNDSGAVIGATLGDLTTDGSVLTITLPNTYTTNATQFGLVFFSRSSSTGDIGSTSTYSNVILQEGIEIIKDSPYEFWNGDVIKQQEESAANMTSLLLQNTTLSQEQVVPNGNYTVSFKYQKLIQLSTVKCIINDVEYELDSMTEKEFVSTFIVSSQHINMKFISDIDNACKVYDIMVNAGSVKLAYSQNQNETTTDTVNISKGITITSSNTDTIFKANADGIRTYDRNGNIKTRFTDTGMTTKQQIVEEQAEIVGVLIQQIGDQTWFTRL